MLVLSKAEGKSDLIIHALKNNFEADAYFVKVMGKWVICPVRFNPPPLHMSWPVYWTGSVQKEESTILPRAVLFLKENHLKIKVKLDSFFLA